jgi:ring-1,2-phenylacetyl-CoA epoxidase subunit PaaC
MMQPALQTALVARLTALADDELILAHRNAEWTGHAPILEEDIAIANIAQDELGHATLYYGLVQNLSGVEPDQLVFFRDGPDFRNVQLVELPKGDWAFTMLRQFLFDAYEAVLLEALVESCYAPLAEASAKIRPEELYHLRYSRAWVERLGLGTAESHRRLQSALDRLWPLTGQLFGDLPGQRLLGQAGFFPDLAPLRSRWEALVRPQLDIAELRRPQPEPARKVARSEHTTHLTELLAAMQLVARLDPAAEW